MLWTRPVGVRWRMPGLGPPCSTVLKGPGPSDTREGGPGPPLRVFALDRRCSCLLYSFRSCDSVSQRFSLSPQLKYGLGMVCKNPCSSHALASPWTGPRLASFLHGPEGTPWRAPGHVSQATGAVSETGALGPASFFSPSLMAGCLQQA